MARAQWYTAIAQLTSRMAHPHSGTWLHLKSILARLLMVHPHQTMWHLLPHLAVTKSGDNASKLDPASVIRRNRCLEILQVAKASLPQRPQGSAVRLR